MLYLGPAGAELPEEELLKVHEGLNGKLPPPDEEFPKYTAAHLYAALYVQAAIRGFMTRYDMQNNPEKMDVLAGSQHDLNTRP